MAGQPGRQGRKAGAALVAQRQEQAQADGVSGKTTSQMPRSPAYLTEVGKKEWTRMGKMLRENNLLTDHSLTALAAYCSAYARHVEAEQQLNGPMGYCPSCWDLAKGKEITGTPCTTVPRSHLECPFGKMVRGRMGGFTSSPWTPQNKQALVEVRGFLAEYGFTPATAWRLPRAPTLPPARPTNGNGRSPGQPAKDPRAMLEKKPEPKPTKKKRTKKTTKVEKAHCDTGH